MAPSAESELHSNARSQAISIGAVLLWNFVVYLMGRDQPLLVWVTAGLLGSIGVYFFTFDILGRKPFEIRRVGWILLSVVVLIVCANWSRITGGRSQTSSNSAAANPHRELLSVTPQFLMAFYHRGLLESEADRLAAPYVGKWMKASIVVRDVSNGLNGLMSVVPDTSGDTVFTMSRDPKWRNDLSQLQRGQRITVVGKVWNVSGTWVTLDDCEIVR